LREHRGRRKSVEGWVSVKLPYRPPLDWPRMIAWMQGRASSGVEVAEHRTYRRAVVVDGKPGEIEIALVAHEPYLMLRARLASNEGLIGVVDRARRMFDLNADPLAIGAHLRRSEILKPLVKKRPGIRLPGAWDPFEIAVRAILGQQISVRAATTLAERLVRAYGKPVEGLSDGLTHLFPSPEVLADADIRSVGATGAQARAIGALAVAVASDSLHIASPKGLDDLVERLTALPGIGPWTAHYVAMRACGEPDAFPASDLGLRKAAGIDSQKELERVAEQWRPWRSYAAMYLWASLGDGTTKRRGT
jgi:AraC family transcriptional regulator of adaptative response / DNA-3-methyladenine glycosylase II